MGRQRLGEIELFKFERPMLNHRIGSITDLAHPNQTAPDPPEDSA